MTAISFNDFSLSTKTNNNPNQHHIFRLWHDLFKLLSSQDDITSITQHLTIGDWHSFRSEWMSIDHNDDSALTDWLIGLFQKLFNQSKIGITPTILTHSKDEPEYFPSDGVNPARIEFAHGFFSSALHEISHWCIAGTYRRTLNDFGYWYESDGRDKRTQALFEQLEIKPQAIECLFNQACGRYFYVSRDNLHADFDTTESTFTKDVYQQVEHYLYSPNTLPRDAKRLILAFLIICQNFHQIA